MKLNKEKCVFGVKKLTYLGDVISEDGLKPDQFKVKVIPEFEKPQSKKELQRFLAMVSYQGRYLQNVSAKTTSLRILLEDKNEFMWTRSVKLDKTNASKN